MSKELNIYQKLNNFSVSVGAIKKDKIGSGGKFTYKYTDINGVLEAIRQPLSENELIVLQTIKKENESIFLNTKIINIDNKDEFVEIDVPLFFHNDMQKLGSAITYARRYALVTILNLEQEDDDGKLASENNQNQTVQPQKQPTSIREKFAAILVGNGLNIEDFAEFTGFMKGYKGIDLTNESEKMKLIANIPLLKQFITEFKDYANKQ